MKKPKRWVTPAFVTLQKHDVTLFDEYNFIGGTCILGVRRKTQGTMYMEQVLFYIYMEDRVWIPLAYLLIVNYYNTYTPECLFALNMWADFKFSVYK